MIRLDSNYLIKVDTRSYALVFEEQRQKRKKKTDELVDYTFRDFWYYPTIGQCVKKYRNLVHEQAKTLEDVVKIDLELTQKIEELKKIIFKNK